MKKMENKITHTSLDGTSISLPVKWIDILNECYFLFSLNPSLVHFAMVDTSLMKGNFP